MELNQSLNLKVKRILPPITKTSPSASSNQMMSPKFHLRILKYKLNFSSKSTFFQIKLKFDKQFYIVISTNHLLKICIQEKLGSMQAKSKFKLDCLPYFLMSFKSHIAYISLKCAYSYTILYKYSKNSKKRQNYQNLIFSKI